MDRDGKQRRQFGKTFAVWSLLLQMVSKSAGRGIVCKIWKTCLQSLKTLRLCRPGELETWRQSDQQTSKRCCKKEQIFRLRKKAHYSLIYNAAPTGLLIIQSKYFYHNVAPNGAFPFSSLLPSPHSLLPTPYFSHLSLAPSLPIHHSSFILHNS